MTHRRGFSLLELLVALGIMSVLIALLIPSLAGLSNASRATKCLANMRAVQTAHFTYATDHEGRFVDAGLSHGALLDESVAWITTLEAYIDGSTLVLQSPLDESPHWPVSMGGEGKPVEGTTDRFRRTTYGVNNYLTSFSPGQRYERLSQVANPRSTVHFLFMVETGAFAGADHVHVENWWISDSLPDAPPALADDHVKLHAVRGDPIESFEFASRGWQSESNYGFLDGHAETLAFSTVYRTFEHNRFDPMSVARSVLFGDSQ